MTTVAQVRGYYNDNKFYEDAEYTIEIQGELNTLYIDIPSSDKYTYDGESFIIQERVFYTINTLNRVITKPFYIDEEPVTAVVADQESNALVFEIDAQTDSGAYLAPAAQGIIVDLDGNVVVNPTPAGEVEPEPVTQQPEIFIRVKNANNNYIEVIPDILVSNDDNKLRFAWVLNEPVTSYAGTVTFSIQFKVAVFSATRNGVTWLPGDTKNGIAYSDITPFDVNYVWKQIKNYQWQTLTSTFEVAKSLDMEQEEAGSLSIQDQFYYEVFDALARLEKKIGSGGSGGDITVDANLDINSPNPVENKAILTALNTKSNSTLTSPVTIDGVEYTTIDSALIAIVNLINNYTYLTT